MLLVYGTLIFFLVTLSSVVLVAWLWPSKTKKRLQTLSSNTVKNADWEKVVIDIAHPFAKLSTPEGKWEESPLRLKFIQAGIRNAHAPQLFFACKTILPLLFAAIAFIALTAFVDDMKRLHLITALMIFALIGCYLPNILLHRIASSRQLEIFENFPDAADLMLVCVEAGLGIEAAMARVAEEIRTNSSAVAEEIHLTNLETRAGATREVALRNLALRTGIEEVHIFAAMLTQADKFGTSIGESLRVFSDDLRHKREMKAEEKAAKVPVKLMFPTILCIFPSILLIVLTPAGIKIFRTVAKILST